MNYEQAQDIAHNYGMTLVRKEVDYRVNYQKGIEATAYYTDDLEDAVETAKQMSKMRFRVQRQPDGYFQVYDNSGAVICVCDETYQVCENIASAANGLPTGVGETDEIGTKLRERK